MSTPYYDIPTVAPSMDSFLPSSPDGVGSIPSVPDLCSVQTFTTMAMSGMETQGSAREVGQNWCPTSDHLLSSAKGIDSNSIG